MTEIEKRAFADLTEVQRKDRLFALAIEDGCISSSELLEDCHRWAANPPAQLRGICASRYCNHLEFVASDEHAGWCPECNTHSVVSPLVLAGLI